MNCCLVWFLDVHSNRVIWFVFVKAYTEPTASYLHGQPVYPGHQQGVVVQQGGTVTTIVTSQTVQQVIHTHCVLFTCKQTIGQDVKLWLILHNCKLILVKERFIYILTLLSLFWGMWCKRLVIKSLPWDFQKSELCNVILRKPIVSVLPQGGSIYLNYSATICGSCPCNANMTFKMWLKMDSIGYICKWESQRDAVIYDYKLHVDMQLKGIWFFIRKIQKRSSKRNAMCLLLMHILHFL